LPSAASPEAVDLRVGAARVRSRGAGPAFLLLHGNPDTAELWDPVAGRLADLRRCLAPDLPGFGASDVPTGFDFSLESMAQWVNGVVDGLGIDGPVDLAVHDFGGPFGLAWAVRYPERVGRLILSNTIFFADYRWHAWARVWRTPVLGELSMLLMNRVMFSRELRRGGPGLPAEHIRSSWERLRWRTRRTVLRLYRATDPESFAGWEGAMVALAREKQALVLWGGRDPYIGAGFAGRFGTDQVQVFPEIGHWVPLEAPEAWARAAREFLLAPAAQPAGSP